MLRPPASTSPPRHEATDVMQRQRIEHQAQLRRDPDRVQPSGRCRSRSIEMGNWMEAKPPSASAASTGQHNPAASREQHLWYCNRIGLRSMQLNPAAVQQTLFKG